MKSVLLALLFTSTLVGIAEAHPISGQAAFQTLNRFVNSAQPWGKSALGECELRFDVQADPIEHYRFDAYLFLDRPAGEVSNNFRDSIGYSGMALSKISANQIEINGGGENGSTRIYLEKQRDGSVLVKANWDDRASGPNREGACRLPSKRSKRK